MERSRRRETHTNFFIGRQTPGHISSRPCRCVERGFTIPVLPSLHRLRPALHRTHVRLKQLKVFVSEPEPGGFSEFIGASSARGDIEIVGVGRTGLELATAIDSGDFDALVFPDAWAEMCRAIRVSSGLSNSTGPSFVVGATTVTSPLIIKSALFGFDGVVPARTSPHDAASRVVDIVAGTFNLANEPLVRELGLRPGALSRKITAEDDTDHGIAELLATGLSDDDIAKVTGHSVQVVRNRIEHMIHANGLEHRTQLAVLKASLWEVPEFS